MDSAVSHNHLREAWRQHLARSNSDIILDSIVELDGQKNAHRCGGRVDETDPDTRKGCEKPMKVLGRQAVYARPTAFRCSWRRSNGDAVEKSSFIKSIMVICRVPRNCHRDGSPMQETSPKSLAFSQVNKQVLPPYMLKYVTST